MSKLPNIFETIRELKERVGPLPRAVWVVDTPWALREIDEAYMRRGFIAVSPGPAAGCFAGPLPVYGWRNTPVPEAEHYERSLRMGRWFVRWPGVWLEMSDGRHIQAPVTTLAEAQRLAETLLGDYRAPTPTVHIDPKDLGIPDTLDWKPWRKR